MAHGVPPPRLPPCDVYCYEEPINSPCDQALYLLVGKASPDTSAAIPSGGTSVPDVMRKGFTTCERKERLTKDQFRQCYGGPPGIPVVQTDPGARRLWEKMLQKPVDRRGNTVKMVLDHVISKCFMDAGNTIATNIEGTSERKASSHKRKNQGSRSEVTSKKASSHERKNPK